MNPQVKEITKENPRVVCQYCHKSEIHSLEWGPLYQLGGVTVHYFCMLFSAGLSQNGQDEEGILGFLPNDIKKELKRGTKLKCKFCKLPQATIGCSVKNCKASYHYPCGLEKKCSFQFLGNYESYCTQHTETVDIPLPRSEWDCPICFTEIGKDETPLWPPCCQKKVFHKSCILHSANSSGVHFFKCPLCNDKDKFSVAMRKSGVYLPDRDAQWETEPNAYVEHTQTYSKCDAVHCLCPKGNEYASKSDGKWKVIRCGACGAAGIHRKCGNLKNLTWRCEICARILSDKRKNESINCSRIQRHQYDLSSDEEEEESDIIAVNEVISELPEVESSSTISTGSSSEEEMTKKVTKTTSNRLYGRPVTIDNYESPLEDSPSEDDDSDSDSNMFIQHNSKLRQKLKAKLVSTESSVKDVWKSKPRGILRDGFKYINVVQNNNLCTQKFKDSLLKRLDKYVEASDAIYEEWESTRTSCFESKLNDTIVKCCRQSSSTDTPGNLTTDNGSNPVRTDRSGYVTPVPFHSVGRNNLIKMGSSKKMGGQVPIVPSPEIISETETTSRRVQIGLDSDSRRENKKKESKTASVSNKIARGASDSDSGASEDNDIAVLSDLKETTHEKSVITVDDDSSSDIEIVSEKIQPKPMTQTSAFLELVRKSRQTSSKPSAPIIRLGVDDDQIDDIDYVDVDGTINLHKWGNNFSSFDRDTALPSNVSISAAFRAVIGTARGSNKPQYSGRAIDNNSLTSVMRNRVKSGPDRDVAKDLVELSDDEDTVQSSTSGEIKESSTSKCSKKRLIVTDPSIVKERSTSQSKKPRN